MAAKTQTGHRGNERSNYSPRTVHGATHNTRTRRSRNVASVLDRQGVRGEPSRGVPAISLFAEPVHDPSGGRIPHDVRRNMSSNRQVGLVVLIATSLTLTILGVIMVFSATSATSISLVTNSGGEATLMSFSVALRHFVWVIISLVVALFFALFPAIWVERFCYWIFAVFLAMQIITGFAGVEVGGNRNWLDLGFAQVQPSEFLKWATIVCIAHILARLQLKDYSEFNRQLLFPVGIFLLAVMAVVLGRDMGTAIIFVMIGAGMFWIAGLGKKLIAIVGLLGALLAGILVAVEPSRLRRVIDYVDNFFAIPDTIDPTQSEFAQFAFGSGGWFGVGLGAGKEKWRDLAEAQTDYIYAVVGEELGLIGALVVLALFLALGWAMFTIIRSMTNRYMQLVVIGAALWICGQGLINMAVVTGLLPVFGVPLPFLSQGGSSMLAVYSMLGTVVGIVRYSDENRSGDRRSARLARGSVALFTRRERQKV